LIFNEEFGRDPKGGLPEGQALGRWKYLKHVVLPGVEASLLLTPTTTKNQDALEALMLAFQLIGLAFTVMFFGAMITGGQSPSR
jgi:hypothetical protein